MLKKLIVLAITSGLAAKLYKSYVAKNAASGGSVDPNRTSTDVTPADKSATPRAV